MKKIPTLFVRDQADMSRVLPEYHPACLWVPAGDGVATRKYDGTCVMLGGEGNWWARREVKPGKRAPEHFHPIQTDEVTGKTMGWEPIAQSAFAKFHAEAINTDLYGTSWEPGTYELIGPKVNGNPEGADGHVLIYHREAERLPGAPRTFYELDEYLSLNDIEGIVWHHPDGRMAKIKGRDFGHRRAER